MGRRTLKFTVIAWATASYAGLARGLRRDCRRLGYPFHLYEVDAEYPSLVRAWCNHPAVIRRGVEEFGTVLFLDVECRIPTHKADNQSAMTTAVASIV